jgi:Spy/CpxP family protein refolding chaperone
MRRPVALLAIGVLFLVGIAVGVLATHAFYAWQIHRPGGLAALGVEVLGNRLDRQLDLTGEQRRQLDAILADTRSELAQVRHETVPRVLAIRARAFDRLQTILTPEQQERLRRFRARNQRAFERLVGTW